MSSRFALAALALVLLGAAAGAQIRPDAVMLRYPDVGERDIVLRYAGDLWIVPKEGGTARRISSAPGAESFPKLSPDGTRVAFTASYDGASDLYVLDVAGGVPRRVTHHGAQEVLCDWTPDGQELLYWSSEISGLGRASRILRVDADGGQPTPLPVPYGTFGSIDATGRWLAYTPMSREFRTWKRYRGGLASDIWLFDLQTHEARKITDYEGTDALPMWHGGEVVFVSDRGERNVLDLWAYDVSTGATRQLTHFEEHDVEFPSMGPQDVVFLNGGSIWRYVLATGAVTRVEIEIPGDRPDLRPRAHDVSALVATVAPGPSGKRAIVEARGELFSLPVGEGAPRNLTRTSGIAERYPAWSPDARWIAYVSDRSGEYELWLRRADGEAFEGADENGERRLTSLGERWKLAPVWAPNSERLVFATNDGALTLCDVTTGEVREIARTRTGFPPALDWSKDSRWLAYADRHSESRLSAIQLVEVETGTVHEVTSGRFDDADPCFDDEGDWLYYRSMRHFEPLYGELDTTWIYADGHRVVAVPLRADVESPLAPTDPVEEIAKADDEDEEEGESDADDESSDEERGEAEETADATADEDDESAADEKDEKDGKDEKDELVAIELEGFEARGMLLPIEAGRLRSLEAVGGKVLFLRSPSRGADGETNLVFYDIEEEKEETILEEANGYQLLACGDKLLVRAGERTAVVPISAGAKIEEDNTLSTKGLRVSVDPREEWSQILADAYRVMRDYFYEPGMHGLDWHATYQRYAGALADATSREDVHWLIGQMIAQLNVGHAYNRGPRDMDGGGDADGERIGYLGCDWTLEDGAYRVARILGGHEAEADARSPLAVHGADVSEGAWLLAVNGVPVDASRAVYAAFAGTAGRPTWITVNAAPAFDGSERDVLVEPLASESALRYRTWVADNGRHVAERSNGRIGYVHVPDTGRNGQNELVRQLFGQLHTDALIVDERWNGGGQIPTRFIELLDRPTTNFWATRHGEDWTWPPDGHSGPKAMLINGAAGSGGDCFPYYFRQAGLGELIGTRTWGGLVGISGNPGFVDGASVSVPTFGFYELDGTWGVEGYGVPPDIEVVDDPALMADGGDPQLDAAIDHLLEKLSTWQPLEAGAPQGPDRRGAGVTPADR